MITGLRLVSAWNVVAVPSQKNELCGDLKIAADPDCDVSKQDARDRQPPDEEANRHGDSAE
jgi:hypothetical protein